MKTSAGAPKDCLRLHAHDCCSIDKVTPSSDVAENYHCLLVIRFGRQLQHPIQTISEAITTMMGSLPKVPYYSDYLRGRLCAHETIHLLHHCHQKQQRHQLGGQDLLLQPIDDRWRRHCYLRPWERERQLLPVSLSLRSRIVSHARCDRGRG